MRRTHVSRWEKATTIAAWAQTVLVVASLVFIGVQINQQVDLNRAANAHAFVALGQPIDLRLSEHDMTKLWLKKKEAREVTDAEIQEDQFKTMLSNYLVFYENVYVQYESGLVDKKFFLLWDNAVRNFVLKYPIEAHWDETKGSYHETFRARVDEVLREKANMKPTPAVSPSVVVSSSR